MTRTCISALLAAGLPAAATAQPNLRAEHQRVLDELNRTNGKGQPRELGDPGVAELVNKGWRIAGRWAAAWLNARTAPSDLDLQYIFRGFAPPPKMAGDEYAEYFFRGSAIQAGPDVYVVQASYVRENSTGTFIVIARNSAGRFQALWNIKDLAAKHRASCDEIGRWQFLVSMSYYSGPLDVQSMRALPPAASGNPRFLVNAMQIAHGGTALAQLSIWEWNGSAALPLLVEHYHFALGQPRLRFDGRTLRIRVKEETCYFASCGGCNEPRATWTIRIAPEGVKDLGRRFFEPEVQWTDHLLTRLASGKDTASLADPEVTAALAASKPHDWGMYGFCRVLRRGPKGEFELVLDERRLRFRYTLRGGRPYFTHVAIH